MIVRYHVPVIMFLMVAGCGSDDKSDAQFKAEIVTGMKQLVLTQIQGLNQAARDLQTAAPTPVGRGWDTTLDGKQIADMTVAWNRTRLYWEQAEGTLACLFPDLDGSMDSRYENALVGGDVDPFDGQGVTGMHAIERILFVPTTPATVVTYEMSLPGYLDAAWPATDTQAATFKAGLCQQLVTDTQSLLDMWNKQPIDLATVFHGITGLMSAQAEKVGLAVDQKEESRYSQTTMADLRYNLLGTAGTMDKMGTGGIYGLFRPWLATKAYGAMLDSSVMAAFAGLATTYGTVMDAAIPRPPASWIAGMPTPDDHQSPFGKLYDAVVQETDLTRPGSAVAAMNQVANALGLPEFTGQECP